MTPDQLAIIGAMGEVLGSIFTLIAIVVSLYLSIKALKETQIDRRLTKAPFLAFVPGGHDYEVEYYKINKSSHLTVCSQR